MSLPASLRPATFSFSAAPSFSRPAPFKDGDRAFHQQPTYLNLSRRLASYAHLILLTPSHHPDTSDDVFGAANATEMTPSQHQTQTDLWSPLPFYRTKWLRNIEGARNTLLQLERQAQRIKVQRTRQAVQKDLAEKRLIVKRLRSKVEEIGREVEAMGDEKWVVRDDELDDRESAWDILQRKRRRVQADVENEEREGQVDGMPVQQVEEEEEVPPAEKARDELFAKSSNIRRRGGQETTSPESPSIAKATGYKAGTGMSDSERALMLDARTHEGLTASLVSLASQLKQQSRNFQFSLDQDRSLLDRALEGLDKNITGMQGASKNMQFLKRMSEGEGWWGRMKLYAMIFAMWLVAVLLVFVGPKLRF